jgi:hypothetical protein
LKCKKEGVDQRQLAGELKEWAQAGKARLDRMMDGLGLEGDGDETGDGAARRTAVVMMKVVMMKRPSKQLRRHCCVLCLSVQWLGWVDQRETAKHARCLGGWGISTLEMALPRDGTKFKNLKSPPFFPAYLPLSGFETNKVAELRGNNAHNQPTKKKKEAFLLIVPSEKPKLRLVRQRQTPALGRHVRGGHVPMLHFPSTSTFSHLHLSCYVPSWHTEGDRQWHAEP